MGWVIGFSGPLFSTKIAKFQVLENFFHFFWDGAGTKNDYTRFYMNSCV